MTHQRALELVPEVTAVLRDLLCSLQYAETYFDLALLIRPHAAETVSGRHRGAYGKRSVTLLCHCPCR
jgi:hypothetical protein